MFTKQRVAVNSLCLTFHNCRSKGHCWVCFSFNKSKQKAFRVRDQLLLVAFVYFHIISMRLGHKLLSLCLVTHKFCPIVHVGVGSICGHDGQPAGSNQELSSHSAGHPPCTPQHTGHCLSWLCAQVTGSDWDSSVTNICLEFVPAQPVDARFND